MRNLEYYSYDADQPSAAEVNAETTEQQTTWEDVAALRDQMNESEPPVDDRTSAIERIEKLRLSDEELIQMAAEWDAVTVDQETLQKATARNGNPNKHGRGLFFDSGNLPMSDSSVYRHVGSSAIVVLMTHGFVRNKREAADALDFPGKGGFGTSGAGVYWYDGDSQKREKADLVIQASKAAAESGYVTKDDVQGIWVTDKNTGLPINLIDGQDHSGLEIAGHKP